AKQAANIGFGDEVCKLPSAGEFFFAASADKTVRQFKLQDQGEVRRYNGMTDSALSVAYHAATNRVAAGGFDGRVMIWNTTDGATIANFLAAPGYKAP
ncbi:MAG TPA: hypothetical protein VL096_17765, partial [Pirellulaceae bacterium]|nr:hypothetical protein [Pirellulaceae bacterium]